MKLWNENQKQEKACLRQEVARLCTQVKWFPMVSIIGHNWLTSQPTARCHAKSKASSLKFYNMYFGHSLRGSWHLMFSHVSTWPWSRCSVKVFGGGLELHSSPGRFLQSKHFSPAPWTPGQKIRRTNFWQRTSAKESRRELCTTGKGGERWKYTAENHKAVVQLSLSVNRCVNGCAGTSPSDALVHYCFCSLWACEGRYFQRCFETHGLSLQP